MTHSIASPLLALLFAIVGACGPRPAPTTPSAPPRPAEVTPPAPEAAPPIARLRFGGWPGSNTHRWGSRFLELRGEGTQTEIRLHDQISFQGAGMQPEDMPPSRHTCSAWQPAPSTIQIPAALRSATDCQGAKAMCTEIKAWLDATKADTGGSC